MTDWISVVVSVLALLLAGLSYLRDRKNSRESAASAAAAETRADQAVAAAQEAVEAQKRMAAALEAQQPPAPEVAWELRHFQGDAYWLENTGAATAYEVQVQLGDGLAKITGEALNADELTPHNGLKFMTIAGFGSGDRDVEVSWLSTPTSADRQTWTRPLPPRPPRT